MKLRPVGIFGVAMVVAAAIMLIISHFLKQLPTWDIVVVFFIGGVCLLGEYINHKRKSNRNGKR